ncbi:M23 family metallopeptidase [Micromonospora yangpuensis]|uniref:Peptidase family M23 n=1 Tax=Micromonospora yangpuensis TaxID=683228 RepID=A0A1C6UXR5_9ACTN|nr:M23 family metallopeptidase [Micromonospora yangpuensis]SCL58826.1 Peptidase family M23 [Micromonospora yangpuensis]
MIESLQRAARRLLVGGLGLAVVAMVIIWSWPGAGTVFEIALFTGTGVGLLGAAGIFLPVGDSTASVRDVHPPVAGRWLALNSPASRVPSHGTRSYGQAYAIDLIHDPLPGAPSTRPVPGEGPGMRPASDYPGFGQPVLAMVTGTVVRVTDGARDHRSRTRVWSLLYLYVEGALRDIAGTRQVLGNHIVVDAGDGCFALVAHLARGSALVRVGDRVEAGQPVGRCGNSGNSSEPHVHAQLMDRAEATSARGLPLRFTGIRIDHTLPTDDTPPTGNAPLTDDAPLTDGLPATGQHLTTS